MNNATAVCPGCSEMESRSRLRDAGLWQRRARTCWGGHRLRRQRILSLDQASSSGRRLRSLFRDPTEAGGPANGVGDDAARASNASERRRPTQGSAALHQSQPVSTKSKHAQSGVYPLERGKKAQAVHRGDACKENCILSLQI